MSAKMERLKHALSKDPVPQIFVFDVDYTLWSAWVDTSNGAPFRRDPHDSDAAIDRGGYRINLFPEARGVLECLRGSRARITVASRTPTPDDARNLIAALDLLTYFDNGRFMQIYPGKKTSHFQRIRAATGVKFDQMLFFDDEQRNINDVSKLGVTSILVDESGVSFDTVLAGIEQFRASVGRASR